MAQITEDGELAALSGSNQYSVLDKEKQPLLSLHGHIHESPDTEKGKWINQIHQTTCIQTGQTELNDKYMVYAEIDLQEKKYERKVISVD